MFENHVPSDRLFDPDVSGPPMDAFDVQFRMPLSLGVYVDQLARDNRSHELADIQELYESLIEEVVVRMQHMCGYVGPLGTFDSDARLAITPVVEPRVPSLDDLLSHAHVYVGGTATRLIDEQPGPLDEARLRQHLFGGVWPSYSVPLEERTTERYGLTWDRANAGIHEIIDPPLAEQAATMQRVACPGRWGRRRLVLADESYLTGCAESEAIKAHERAIGMPGAG